jgi:hypothetical protein
MSAFTAVVKQLLLTQMLSNTLPSTKHHKIGDSLLLLTTVLGSVALLFLILALYIWLKENYEPEMAALLTGAVALILACLAGGAAFWVSNRRLLKVNHFAHDAKKHLLSLVENFTEDLEEPIRKHPKVAVLLAGIIGYILGDRVL